MLSIEYRYIDTVMYYPNSDYVCVSFKKAIFARPNQLIPIF
jgi:hypothetical protein